MIGIKVCRNGSFPGECRDDDSALYWGDDILNALLATEVVAIERGRVAIDKQYTNRYKRQIDLPSLNFLQPVSMVTIDGEKGLVRSIRLSVSNTGVKTSIDIESKI